jgi:hypothetical protein
VYRQRADSSDALTLLDTSNNPGNQTGTGSFYVLDVVSFKNQLVHDAEYIYYVTANSGQGITGRAVAADTSTVINDGSASNTVIANIPAQGTAVTGLIPPAAEGETAKTLDANAIKAEQVTVSSWDKLLLTWNHYHPAFQYTVAYGLGTTNNVTVTNSYNGYDLTQGGVLYAHTLPLFGGTNNVKITVTLNGGDNFYYKPSEINKPLQTFTVALSKPTNFKVTRDSTTNGTSATIEWTAVSGAPKYGNYKLYKIVAKNIEQDGDYYGYKPIEVEEDWTLVDDKVTLIEEGTTIKVVESGLDSAKGYLYALVADNGTAKSEPAVYRVAPGSIAAPAAFKARAAYVENTEGKRDYHAVISWGAQAGNPKYELARAAKDGDTLGEYTLAIGGPTLTAEGGRYTVTDPATIRKSYTYRLTATINEVQYLYFTDLDGEPYREEGNWSLSAKSSENTAYAVELTIGENSYLGDVTVDIYRAKAAESSQVGYFTKLVDESAFTRLKEGASLDKGNKYVDLTGILGETYVYRFEVKAKDGAVLTNTNPKLLFKAGIVVQPSKPHNVTSITTAGKLANNDQYFKVTKTYGDNNPLADTKIQLQYRKDGSADTVTWTDSGAPVLVHKAMSDLTEGSEVSEDDWYFVIREPSQTLQTTNEYRLVVVDQDGNTAKNDNTASAINSTTVGNW